MKALVFPLGFGGYELDVNIENLGYSLVKGNKEVLSTDPKEGFVAELIKFGQSTISMAIKEARNPDSPISLVISVKGSSLSVTWNSKTERDLGEEFRTRDRVYGAGLISPQYFPMEAEIKADRFPAGNVQLPYLATSSGVGVLIRSYEPLSVGFRKDENGESHFYLRRRGTTFNYEVLLATDMRALHRELVARVGKPRSSPADVLFSRPIYSTWAEYKKDVNQEKVLSYAADVAAKGFPIGTIEIDDKWEVNYGDFEFDSTKFPDPAGMVKALHKAGFSVTLWVYPFVNVESKNHSLLGEQHLLVMDESGKPLSVRWWDGEGGLIDFSNPKSREWFKRRLLELRALGFDGFKFDAGDAGFFREGAHSFKNLLPSQYTDAYMEFIAENFSDFAETRVSTFAQSLGLLTRLGDKDSRWGLNNGLRSVVTSTLTYSILGYPFIMPDMVGGNEYGNEKCDAELFARWVEASSPMPSLQFSILPWRYDQRTLAIAREYAWLHVDLSPYLLRLVQESMNEGWPIVRPIFFADAGSGEKTEVGESEIFDVGDEFMIGDGLLFAPVLDQGSTERDIILPGGKWLDLWNGDTVDGPAELKNHGAPLHVLPMFVRAGAELPEGFVEALVQRTKAIEAASSQRRWRRPEEAAARGRDIAPAEHDQLSKPASWKRIGFMSRGSIRLNADASHNHGSRCSGNRLRCYGFPARQIFQE